MANSLAPENSHQPQPRPPYSRQIFSLSHFLNWISVAVHGYFYHNWQIIFFGMMVGYGFHFSIWQYVLRKNNGFVSW